MYEPIFDEFTAPEDDQGVVDPGRALGAEDDDWSFGEDYEPDELEGALGECGRGQDYEGCTLAGTEWCEFECPFRG